MSRCIENTMYLENVKQSIVLNGEVICVINVLHARGRFSCRLDKDVVMPTVYKWEYILAKIMRISMPMKNLSSESIESIHMWEI